jgi:hypothetical protein
MVENQTVKDLWHGEQNHDSGEDHQVGIEQE